jgi:hypothetical protein
VVVDGFVISCIESSVIMRKTLFWACNTELCLKRFTVQKAVLEYYLPVSEQSSSTDCLRIPFTRATQNFLHHCTSWINGYHPIHIWEIPDSNLIPQNSYTEWGISVIFLSLSRKMPGHNSTYASSFTAHQGVSYTETFQIQILKLT